METKLPKYTVDKLSFEMLPWFVEVAAVNMLKDELKKPELVHLPELYRLAKVGMDWGTAFVVYDGSVPVGALGAILTDNLFNPEYKTLAEIFWYVLPEYRETRAGFLLLQAFENRGKEIAYDMTLSLLPQSPVNIKALEKRGFAFEELSFRKYA